MPSWGVEGLLLGQIEGHAFVFECGSGPERLCDQGGFLDSV